MANPSIYAAFERLWQHITARLNKLASKEELTDSLVGLATETYVDNKVASLVDSAPGTLDTLNELAQALGDDPNFATTITNQLSEVRELINNDEDFYTQPTEPTEAVDGDFWVDTSESTYVQKKIYESPIEPQNSQDGDMWIDTSDMV